MENLAKTSLLLPTSERNFALVYSVTVSGYFKVASCTRAFRMYDSFWDAFPVEMRQLLDQVNILKNYRSIIARG